MVKLSSSRVAGAAGAGGSDAYEHRGELLEVKVL